MAANVLDMTVEEALEFFKAVPLRARRAHAPAAASASNTSVGQQATTLSGGEAQRIKLAKELPKRATGRTLYISTSRPPACTSRHPTLLDVLHRLVDRGNTVVVIEHNLDVIKTADWIIDLGPEGGDGGGEIVAVGTPEDITQEKRSYNGRVFAAGAGAPRRGARQGEEARRGGGVGGGVGSLAQSC